MFNKTKTLKKPHYSTRNHWVFILKAAF